jgi:hypothetical protein
MPFLRFVLFASERPAGIDRPCSRGSSEALKERETERRLRFAASQRSRAAHIARGSVIGRPTFPASECRDRSRYRLARNNPAIMRGFPAAERRKRVLGYQDGGEEFAPVSPRESADCRALTAQTFKRLLSD